MKPAFSVVCVALFLAGCTFVRADALALADRNTLRRHHLLIIEKHETHAYQASKQNENSSIDIGAMVVEPHCHAALPLVVWNMRNRLPSLPIQLFHTDENNDCVKAWFGGMERMTLTKLPESDFVWNDHSDMSKLFTTSSFWDKVEHKKILFFHTNTWICANDAEQKLQQFLKYDYIGAPWANEVQQCEVGNGGFSLRTVQVMKEISAIFGPTRENEDLYFCRHLQDRRWVQSMHLPDRLEAGEFSAEEYDGAPNGATLGMHNAYAFNWYDSDYDFKQHCPGVALVEFAAREGATYIHNCNLALQRGLELVQMAKEHLPSSNYYQMDCKKVITILYRTVLCREPDPPGLDYWSNQCLLGAAAADEIELSFRSSGEYRACSICQTSCKAKVQQQQLRGTASNGLVVPNDSKQSKNGGQVPAFARYPETQQNKVQLAKGQDQKDCNSILHALYQTVLCRDPDESGLRYWTQQCLQGFTEREMEIVMKDGDEYRRCTICKTSCQGRGVVASSESNVRESPFTKQPSSIIAGMHVLTPVQQQQMRAVAKTGLASPIHQDDPVNMEKPFYGMPDEINMGVVDQD